MYIHISRVCTYTGLCSNPELESRSRGLTLCSEYLDSSVNVAANMFINSPIIYKLPIPRTCTPLIHSSAFPLPFHIFVVYSRAPKDQDIAPTTPDATLHRSYRTRHSSGSALRKLFLLYQHQNIHLSLWRRRRGSSQLHPFLPHCWIHSFSSSPLSTRSTLPWLLLVYRTKLCFLMESRSGCMGRLVWRLACRCSNNEIGWVVYVIGYLWCIN